MQEADARIFTFAGIPMTAQILKDLYEATHFSIELALRSCYKAPTVDEVECYVPLNEVK